jgi:hypothetical protein
MIIFVTCPDCEEKLMIDCEVVLKYCFESDEIVKLDRINVKTISKV